MSEFIVEQQPLPDPNDFYNKGKEEIKDVRELVVGAGSNIFYTDKEGSRWGNIVFDDAKAYIKMDGSFKFKASDGTVLIDSLGGGTGDYINIINSALDSSSRTILSDWTFESTDYAGAFKSGSITWSTTTGLVTGGTGIVINDRGIIGAASGVATFTIDATTGNATFAGTLVAASGTLGSITIGSNAWHVDSSGNMWWGSAASYAAATIKISSAGVANLTGATIQGTIKATGSGSGADVWLNPGTGSLEFYYNGSTKAFIYSNSTGDLVIDADNFIYLVADGSGDDIAIQAEDVIFLDSRSFFVTATGGTDIESDGVFVEYNMDNNGADHKWYSNGDNRMNLNQSGNLSIDGTYSDGGADYAEFFESIDGKKIPVGTTVALVNGKVAPASEHPNSPIIGVISVQSSFIGNNGGADAGESWGGKYDKDEFGQYIYEESEWWKAEIIVEHEKPNGKVHLKKEQISGWTDRDEIPEGAKNIRKKMSSRKKINSAWNSDTVYIPRSERPEWNVVGLVGQVRIKVGQPVAKNWVKMRTLSPTVEEWLIR